MAMVDPNPNYYTPIYSGDVLEQPAEFGVGFAYTKQVHILLPLTIKIFNGLLQKAMVTLVGKIKMFMLLVINMHKITGH